MKTYDCTFLSSTRILFLICPTLVLPYKDQANLWSSTSQLIHYRNFCDQPSYHGWQVQLMVVPESIMQIIKHVIWSPNLLFFFQDQITYSSIVAPRYDCKIVFLKFDFCLTRWENLPQVLSISSGYKMIWTNTHVISKWPQNQRFNVQTKLHCKQLFNFTQIRHRQRDKMPFIKIH